MFSKRARYAMHGVGFLAYHHPHAPVPFAEILRYLRDYSRELSFSPGYISKVFQELSRGGIVRTIAGCKGGYALGRPPEEIRILDVVTAVDGRRQEDCCLLSVGGCSNQTSCGVNRLICEAEGIFYRFLSEETAESLAAKMFRERGPLGSPRYRRTPAGKARRAVSGGRRGGRGTSRG